MLGHCVPPTIPVNFVPICRTTASQFNKIFSNYFKNLCRFAIYWPILFKLNSVVRNALANNACKFHEDRLKGGVTIYFIVAKPRGRSETSSRFLQRSDYRSVWRTARNAAYRSSRLGTPRHVGGRRASEAYMDSQEAKTEIYLRQCCYDSGPILVFI